MNKLTEAEFAELQADAGVPGDGKVTVIVFADQLRKCIAGYRRSQELEARVTDLEEDVILLEHDREAAQANTLSALARVKELEAERDGQMTPNHQAMSLVLSAAETRIAALSAALSEAKEALGLVTDAHSSDREIAEAKRLCREALEHISKVLTND